MPPKDEEKKFTQAEFDSALGKRLADERKKLLDLERQRDEHKTVADAARARICELETQVTMLTSERDAVRTQLDAHAVDHAALKTQHAATVGEHRRFRAELAITQALIACRALPSAAPDAAALMMTRAQIEQDDAGAITAITWNGARFTSAEAAAEAFLKTKPFYASNGGASGGGTRPPNSGGLPIVPRDLTSEDPRALANEGWRSPHHP
jgi:hypothetical protein